MSNLRLRLLALVLGLFTLNAFSPAAALAEPHELPTTREGVRVIPTPAARSAAGVPLTQRAVELNLAARHSYLEPAPLGPRRDRSVPELIRAFQGALAGTDPTTTLSGEWARPFRLLAEIRRALAESSEADSEVFSVLSEAEAMILAKLLRLVPPEGLAVAVREASLRARQTYDSGVLVRREHAFRAWAMETLKPFLPAHKAKAEVDRVVERLRRGRKSLAQLSPGSLHADPIWLTSASERWIDEYRQANTLLSLERLESELKEVRRIVEGDADTPSLSALVRLASQPMAGRFDDRSGALVKENPYESALGVRFEALLDAARRLEKAGAKDLARELRKEARDLQTKWSTLARSEAEEYAKEGQRRIVMAIVTVGSLGLGGLLSAGAHGARAGLAARIGTGAVAGGSFAGIGDGAAQIAEHWDDGRLAAKHGENAEAFFEERAQAGGRGRAGGFDGARLGKAMATGALMGGLFSLAPQPLQQVVGAGFSGQNGYEAARLWQDDEIASSVVSIVSGELMAPAMMGLLRPPRSAATVDKPLFDWSDGAHTFLNLVRRPKATLTDAVYTTWLDWKADWHEAGLLARDALGAFRSKNKAANLPHNVSNDVPTAPSHATVMKTSDLVRPGKTILVEGKKVRVPHWIERTAEALGLSVESVYTTARNFLPEDLSLSHIDFDTLGTRGRARGIQPDGAMGIYPAQEKGAVYFNPFESIFAALRWARSQAKKINEGKLTVEDLIQLALRAHSTEPVRDEATQKWEYKPVSLAFRESGRALTIRNGGSIHPEVKRRLGDLGIQIRPVSPADRSSPPQPGEKPLYRIENPEWSEATLRSPTRSHHPAAALLELVENVNQMNRAKTPAEIVAAYAIQTYLLIHPMQDKNGRTARLFGEAIYHARTGKDLLLPSEFHREMDYSLQELTLKLVRGTQPTSAPPVASADASDLPITRFRFNTLDRVTAERFTYEMDYDRLPARTTAENSVGFLYTGVGVSLKGTKDAVRAAREAVSRMFSRGWIRGETGQRNTNITEYMGNQQPEGWRPGYFSLTNDWETASEFAVKKGEYGLVYLYDTRKQSSLDANAFRDWINGPGRALVPGMRGENYVPIPTESETLARKLVATRVAAAFLIDSSGTVLEVFTNQNYRVPAP